mmetsp:Transcript_9568/g.17930  ORF Transcript_9568/g.17930 Transcript_9568/m.17930 type:complete len:368 (-) Transcript_9568:238-1341(-)
MMQIAGCYSRPIELEPPLSRRVVAGGVHVRIGLQRAQFRSLYPCLAGSNARPCSLSTAAGSIFCIARVQGASTKASSDSTSNSDNSRCTSTASRFGRVPGLQGGLERAFRRDVGASPEPTRRAGGRATSQSPPSGGVRAGCIGNPLAHPAEAQDHLLLKHSTLRRSNLLGETSQSPSNIMHSPDRRPIGGGGGATRTRAFQLGVAASDLFGRRLSRTDHSVACHDLDKHNTMRDTWSGLPRSEKFKEGLKQEESGPLTYADGNTNLLRNAYTGFVLAAGAIPKNVVQGGRKQGQSRAMENIGGGGICSRRPCEDAHIPDAIDDMLLLQHERVGDSDHTRRQRRRQILSARNANGIQNAGLRNKYRQL